MTTLKGFPVLQIITCQHADLDQDLTSLLYHLTQGEKDTRQKEHPNTNLLQNQHAEENTQIGRDQM